MDGIASVRRRDVAVTMAEPTEYERTVGWLLDNCRSLDDHLIACLPPRRLTPDDGCILVDGRDLEPGEDISSEARRRGLTTTFGIPQVQDVVANLEQQRTGPTPELQLRALNFYLSHDAFIDLADDDGGDWR